MIVLNYMKDGDKYRIWPGVPYWPGDTFDVISKEQFKAILDLDHLNIFILINYEDTFMNSGTR